MRLSKPGRAGPRRRRAYVHTCVYTHVCIHIYTCIWLCIHVRTYVHACMHTYIDPVMHPSARPPGGSPARRSAPALGAPRLPQGPRPPATRPPARRVPRRDRSAPASPSSRISAATSCARPRRGPTRWSASTTEPARGCCRHTRASGRAIVARDESLIMGTVVNGGWFSIVRWWFNPIVWVLSGWRRMGGCAVLRAGARGVGGAARGRRVGAAARVDGAIAGNAQPRTQTHWHGHAQPRACAPQAHHTPAHTPTRTPTHTHAHAHTHTRTRTRTHAHAGTA